MKVWIVIEYNDYVADCIVGVFDSEEKALKSRNESPVWRYIKECEVE